MNNLELIVQYSPDWVLRIEGSRNSVAFRLKPENSVAVQKLVDLRIWCIGSQLNVSEKEIGKRFPRSCPERHINPDGSFCLGLDLGRDIDSAEAATKWWAHLSAYIKCQKFADRRRFWPPTLGLSHGDAARPQLRAERVAGKLGLMQDYKDAVEFGVGWLSEDLPNSYEEIDKLVGELLVQHKLHVRGSERDYRHAVIELIQEENLRREAELEFVNYVSKAGFTCCGTMDSCPFKIAKITE